MREAVEDALKAFRDRELNVVHKDSSFEFFDLIDGVCGITKNWPWSDEVGIVPNWEFYRNIYKLPWNGMSYVSLLKFYGVHVNYLVLREE